MKQDIFVGVFIGMWGASLLAIILGNVNLAILFAFWASLAASAKDF